MIRFLTLVLAILTLAAPVLAQEANYTALLLAFNHTKPSQNPNYALGKEILGRRLVDKNLRTLGKVEDIVLTNDGTLQAIISTVDTSGFRQLVAFDVKSYVIQPTRDTFMVNMDKVQVTSNLPKLMAAAVPSPGNPPLFTINSLKAGEIRRKDDTLVAHVSDVMIEDKKSQVVALLVVIAGGDKRGAIIAVPYEARKLKHEGGKSVLTVEDDQAEIMISMARRRR